MKSLIYILFQLMVISCLSSCNRLKEDHFVLCSGEKSATIYIHPDAPEFVKLAVEDLVSDVEKISGKKLSLITDLSACNDNCVIIGSVDQIGQSALLKEISGGDLENLKGKWESYIVKNYKSDKHYLFISGSDDRGTMFGIYHFIESYLGVDPLYFWTDREPKKQKNLSWPKVDILQEEPTFKYRGLFINDEDLLTEWKESAGSRFIDYPYYAQVTNPEIMERAVEALVRLRYNLMIPASFIDIGNPPEKQLVDIAAKRGIFLSMHHIEPMGVSGFTFLNYWKKKGKDFKFSYYSNPEALKEVWQVYAEKWAKYPNVIWQIGLRGIADRPMWTADPNVPQSDEERGKLISDAMKVQMEIIKSVDKRDDIPVTSTLWMEGSNLNKEGFLVFPEKVMVIFSDNSPGWVLQRDFYDTPREPGRKYGIYYHHALWGTGPHLVQGIPPSKTYEIFKLAIDHQSDTYAILNVSNIREFSMGLKASSEMLYNFKNFNPDIFLKKWCVERFGKAAKLAEEAYRQFFDSYQVNGESIFGSNQEHGDQNIVFLLDGQMRTRGISLLKDLKLMIADPQKFKKDSSVSTGAISSEELNRKVNLQKEGLEKAGDLAEQARADLDGQDLRFLEVNLISQQKILLGITTWLEALIKATEAEKVGDKKNCITSLEGAVDAFNMILSGQELASRGEKWANWYRGEKKMDLKKIEKMTEEVLEMAKLENK